MRMDCEGKPGLPPKPPFFPEISALSGFTPCRRP
jgi:hypothetical protein